MVHYDIKITGRVQGVGFRSFVKQKAEERDIQGWVKNEPDGSVHVKALGEEKDMEPFLDYLSIGPSMARVKNISKYKIDSGGEYKGFSLKYF